MLYHFVRPFRPQWPSNCDYGHTVTIKKGKRDNTSQSKSVCRLASLESSPGLLQPLRNLPELLPHSRSLRLNLFEACSVVNRISLRQVSN
jgi:hypothetical protein